jgi:hypothetical protein
VDLPLNQNFVKRSLGVREGTINDHFPFFREFGHDVGLEAAEHEGPEDPVELGDDVGGFSGVVAGFENSFEVEPGRFREQKKNENERLRKSRKTGF